MTAQVHDLYGNRIRTRVCGVCIKDEAILLVDHKSLGYSHFWAPPGGGIQFGETAENCLIREVREETGLEVRVIDFLFAFEFIKNPLHAIELFFTVTVEGGILKMGSDPEMKEGQQIIQDVGFKSWNEIESMGPEALHGIFQYVSKPRQIIDLKGYFKL